MDGRQRYTERAMRVLTLSLIHIYTEWPHLINLGDKHWPFGSSISGNLADDRLNNPLYFSTNDVL